MLKIITTISDLIYQAQKASKPVFGIDISKLSKKNLFHLKENDIHSLFRYVKEMKPDDRLPLEIIPNYNIPFELRETHFNPTLRPFVRTYLAYFTYFECSDYPELSNFIEILFNIMIYFESFPCYQTSLLGYIYLLAKGTLPYEEECFHNFFLIDFSESPDTVEAIKHFRLDVKNGNVKFVFKDYDISLLDTFNVLIGKKDFRQHRTVAKEEKK